MTYKRPESVLVVIYTQHAEVLLLQRSDVPNFWQSVTGSLDVGELTLQTAIREVQEETGIPASHGKLQDCQQQNRFLIRPPWKARYAPDVTHNVEHVLTLCLPKQCAVTLNPREHLSYQWLDYSAALERVSSETNRAAIVQWVGGLSSE